MWKMTRLIFFVSFVVLLTVGVLVQTQYLVEKEKALKDSALYGHAFRNETVKTIVECLFSCLEDCLCMAFQIHITTICQLLSSNRFQTPSALSSLPGCIYYDMLPTQLHQLPTCSPQLMCCNQLNLCLNGGTCEDISPNETERFKCSCPPGYTGNRCQYPAIKSCRGYANGDRVAGKFKVLDNNMKPFEVLCDFNKNSNMTWTLIQSYQLKYKEKIISYLSDKAINEDSHAFDLYRLSKSRMESIQQDSSKWRITCQYDSSGVVYTDYVRGSNDEINILMYSQGSTCIKVEYIDIRGQNCKNCSVFFSQSDYYILHSDSYHYYLKNCEFHPKNALFCGGPGEDNFGGYGCTNPAHRCSASPTSTTQTWFGGH